MPGTLGIRRYRTKEFLCLFLLFILSFSSHLAAQEKINDSLIQTGFLGLSFGKKEEAKPSLGKGIPEEGAVPSSKANGAKEAKSVEDIISDATDYAIRRDEEYMLISLKSLLEEYRTATEEEKKAKDTWIKVSAAEGCAILAIVAGFSIALSVRKK